MAKTVNCIRGRKILAGHLQTPSEIAAIKAADKRRKEIYLALRGLGYRNIPRPKQYAKGF